MNFLSEIKESILMAFNAITANKMRTLLATLGIVIGITAVTLMQTVIEGINRAFEDSISAIGADVLYVQKFEWFGKEDWSLVRNRKDINMREYDFLDRNLQSAIAMAPTVGTAQTVKYSNLALENVFIIGTTSNYQITS